MVQVNLGMASLLLATLTAFVTVPFLSTDGILSPAFEPDSSGQ